MAIKHVVTRGFGFADGITYIPSRGYFVQIVLGPFCVVASQSHVPGSLAAQSHVPGSVLAQAHIPGSVSGMPHVPGSVKHQSHVPGSVSAQGC